MYNDVYRQNAEDDPPSTHQPCSYAAEWKNVNVTALILCAQGRLAVRRNACRWRGSTLAGPDSDTEMMFPVFWTFLGVQMSKKTIKTPQKPWLSIGCVHLGVHMGACVIMELDYMKPATATRAASSGCWSVVSHFPHSLSVCGVQI